MVYTLMYIKYFKILLIAWLTLFLAFHFSNVLASGGFSGIFSSLEYRSMIMFWIFAALYSSKIYRISNVSCFFLPYVAALLICFGSFNHFRTCTLHFPLLFWLRTLLLHSSSVATEVVDTGHTLYFEFFT